MSSNYDDRSLKNKTTTSFWQRLKTAVSAFFEKLTDAFKNLLKRLRRPSGKPETGSEGRESVFKELVDTKSAPILNPEKVVVTPNPDSESSKLTQSSVPESEKNADRQAPLPISQSSAEALSPKTSDVSPQKLNDKTQSSTTEPSKAVAPALVHSQDLFKSKLINERKAKFFLQAPELRNLFSDTQIKALQDVSDEETFITTLNAVEKTYIVYMKRIALIKQAKNAISILKPQRDLLAFWLREIEANKKQLLKKEIIEDIILLLKTVPAKGRVNHLRTLPDNELLEVGNNYLTEVELKINSIQQTQKELEQKLKDSGSQGNENTQALKSQVEALISQKNVLGFSLRWMKEIENITQIFKQEIVPNMNQLLVVVPELKEKFKETADGFGSLSDDKLLEAAGSLLKAVVSKIDSIQKAHQKLEDTLNNLDYVSETEKTSATASLSGLLGDISLPPMPAQDIELPTEELSFISEPQTEHAKETGMSERMKRLATQLMAWNPSDAQKERMEGPFISPDAELKVLEEIRLEIRETLREHFNVQLAEIDKQVADLEMQPIDTRVIDNTIFEHIKKEIEIIRKRVERKISTPVYIRAIEKLEAQNQALIKLKNSLSSDLQDDEWDAPEESAIAPQRRSITPPALATSALVAQTEESNPQKADTINFPEPPVARENDTSSPSTKKN